MPEAAQLALEQMNSVMLGGRNIKVSDSRLRYVGGEAGSCCCLCCRDGAFQMVRRA